MKLTIVSIDRSIFTGEVSAVFAKSSQGAFEIRPGHAHFLAELVESDLYYETPDKVRQGLFIAGGVLEVRPDEVMIALDQTKLVDELDEVNIEERMDHLRTNLQQSSVDYALALSELSAMTSQLKLIKKIRRK